MASLFIPKFYQFSTDAGDPLNGGKLSFTVTTTTTNKSTYPTEADAIAGTNANVNPVILDTDGRSPVEIWISGRYRLRTYTSADVLIADDDPVEDVITGSSSQASASNFGGNNSGTANALVFTYSPVIDSYTNGQELSGRITADNTTAVTVNGGAGVKSLVKRDGTALGAGDLQGPDIITFAYDSTTNVMRLTTPDGMLYRNGANDPARVDVADGATIDLTPGTINSRYARLITSTTTITAITLPAGCWCDILFNTVRTLTNNASIIVPGGTRTTAAGDVARVRGEAGGIVRVLSYDPANGLGLVIVPTFESSEQTLVASSTVSVAHSIGALPKTTKAIIRNKTAELGYSIGDEVDVTYVDAPGFGTANLTADATNLKYTINAQYQRVVDRGTFAATVITPGNWKLVLRATA